MRNELMNACMFMSVVNYLKIYILKNKMLGAFSNLLKILPVFTELH